jgi:ferritin-like metal-binding protein YciE
MTGQINAVPETAADSKLRSFFKDQLQDIYWAEHKMARTLPRFAAAATSQKLRNVLQSHLHQTRTHVSRLENVFELIGEIPQSKKCLAMSGIADEGQDMIDETEAGSAQRDVALIFAAQKAEHYEIATYGGLVSLAHTLGYSEAAAILAGTLVEEKETDAMLTHLAEDGINFQACNER